MNEYNTDIVKLTCSCPDWKETRWQYKLNDPRRLCKHIINKLDINNLPIGISKFKESIEFYQEKEWGFKRDFDEIIEIGNFTLLGSVSWIDVFDGDGTRYGYLNDSYTGENWWSKQNKPIGYEKIEAFFKKRFDTIPLPLQGKEKQDIANYIKEVIPSKQNIQFSIEDDQYEPSPDGIYYCLYESTSDYSLEDEVRHIIVKNDEIIIEMYYGKIFKYTRDYKYAKSFLENKKQKEQERLDNERQKYEEELKQKRKIAIEKSYILVQDYEGDLYDIQNIYNHPDGLSWDEYEKVKNSILGNYNTLQHLIKEFSIDITTAKFNKALKNLNFVVKESTLNQNDWILKGDGLQYGINLIKDSKYMHENIPDWYKVHIFDNTKMKLIKLESNFNIKMTSTLFEKNKFNELYQLVKQEIENSQLNNKIIDETTSNKKLERAKWLRHVECPNCGEKTNIHKKDKRRRKNGYIQRFYCNACNSMFQMDIEKLEQMMKDYEKDELNKEKLIITQKETDIQSFEKEVQAVKISQEKNLFKRFFSFFE
ncbi:hypothetical protein M947_10430 [Sulfurimonas hongkongensis]|uniref:SWIM-type domain-containing protein n=1 Tax=Sulfurimonas hongkongensis TaxID=1172190 RepID=T0JDG1_9BACT|nr:hypothetical protein [Sulfurimonas hongkongensis]EQB34872.1 hypothetical protein M947_10430 [Sulfurimonas hongkongensis]